MIRISNIRVPVQQRGHVRQPLLSLLRIPESDLIGYRIFKESIDARRQHMVYFVYTVDVKVRDEVSVRRRLGNKVQTTPDYQYVLPPVGSHPLYCRPIIVGTGPCGLFAGLILAEKGYRPLLLERGESVRQRVQAIERFWSSGLLNPESNVQFGEGGAGTFSDGKLTTNIKDRRCRKVLEVLVDCGAPAEILYSFKPHVGTDKLRGVITNLRRTIEAKGGEIRFGAKVTDLLIKGSRIVGVEINNSLQLPTEVVILAIGHSARDTFEVLLRRGLKMQPKPFAIGMRIEHPQALIDTAQYGRFAGHPNLGAAVYKLAFHGQDRSAYTFCMCPGGYVIAAASEPGYLVTNGMSLHSRSGSNANSAVLVGVGPADFDSGHPLAGVEFQRKWENRAFLAGGKAYKAPVQLVGDFLHNRASSGPGSVMPTYRPGVEYGDLSSCLPGCVTSTLRDALRYWDRKLRGFSHPEAVLTGVETRSSSPVRILRDKSYQANIQGIYPAGEGAGYAGGIVSAAVDGLRVAEAIISKYSPNEVKLDV